MCRMPVAVSPAGSSRPRWLPLWTDELAFRALILAISLGALGGTPAGAQDRTIRPMSGPPPDAQLSHVGPRVDRPFTPPDRSRPRGPGNPAAGAVEDAFWNLLAGPVDPPQSVNVRAIHD